MKLFLKKAFTFTEIIMAAAVLGIVAVPILSLLLRQAESSAIRDRLVAMNLAQQEMEKTFHNKDYANVICLVTAAVILALVAFVIPTFAEMFQDLDARLPYATQTIVNVSNFFLKNYLCLSGILLLLMILLRFLIQSSAGRIIFDRFKLFIPVVGGIVRKSSIARFTRTLGTLIENGIPLIQALETTSKTTGNKVLENGIILGIVIGGILLAMYLPMFEFITVVQ